MIKWTSFLLNHWSSDFHPETLIASFHHIQQQKKKRGYMVNSTSVKYVTKLSSIPDLNKQTNLLVSRALWCRPEIVTLGGWRYGPLMCMCVCGLRGVPSSMLLHFSFWDPALNLELTLLDWPASKSPGFLASACLPDAGIADAPLPPLAFYMGAGDTGSDLRVSEQALYWVVTSLPSLPPSLLPPSLRQVSCIPTYYVSKDDLELISCSHLLSAGIE